MDGKIFYCFVCGSKLDKANSSDEHILLNALGGHLHSPSFLCKKCNSLLGSKFDDELARELNYAASYLDVPRQRGKNQIIRTTDSEYDLLPGGKPALKKPECKVTSNNNRGIIYIKARDEGEARNIIKNLSKKHPSIDAKTAISNMEKKVKYLNKRLPVTLKFDVNKIYPSIIKTAVEYYLFCGGKQETIHHLVPLIKGEGDVKKYCKYYYPTRRWIKNGFDEIEHSLYVKGSSKDGILYGFVSYFGIIQCVVLLNDCYEGPDIESGYGYNVITKSEREIRPEYSLDRDTVLGIINTSFLELNDSVIRYSAEFQFKAELYNFMKQVEKVIDVQGNLKSNTGEQLERIKTWGKH